MLKIQFRWIFKRVFLGIGVLFGLLLLVILGYTIWLRNRILPEALPRQELFSGVYYTREVRIEPKHLIIHVVEIDLTNPDIHFFVTPPDDIENFVYQARTTSQFLEEFNLQLAINADFFDPWRDYGPWDYYPHIGDGVNVSGVTAFNGEVFTEGYGGFFNTVYISENNEVSFNQPMGENFVAISGHTLFVRKGQPLPDVQGNSYITKRHPRTVIALSEDKKTMYWLVVDGRQPNYSDGVNLVELAEIVLKYGGYTALNMDGGGSSTLVMEDDDDSAKVLNSPIHTRIPKRERPVANHLGIYVDS